MPKQKKPTKTYSVRFCHANHGMGWYQRHVSHQTAKRTVIDARREGYDVEIVEDDDD